VYYLDVNRVLVLKRIFPQLIKNIQPFMVPEIHYCVQKNLRLDPILSQTI
jgi:hypothetical protein